MRSLVEARACVGRRFIGGVVLLSVGALFLLSNLGFFEVRLFQVWWPLLLIVLGATRLFNWYRSRRAYSDFA